MIHVITVERSATTLNDYGTASRAWTEVATLRAEIVSRTTEEFLRAQGAVDETAIVFRTRWIAGVTNADRVSFDGKAYNIREVTEIGRRKGLELRCGEVA